MNQQRQQQSQHIQWTQRQRTVTSSLKQMLRQTAAVVAMSLSLIGVGESLPTRFAGSGWANKGAAQAQSIQTDRTTGTIVNSQFSDDVPDGSNAFAITGGALEDSNLFHSFEAFSPSKNYTVFDLTNPIYSDVGNIFNRVTGSGGTTLNGTLEVAGGNSPNLFIINPNGILIGPEANISVPASFLATTAESISFSDGVVFGTANATPNPLLTVSAPVGLQLGASAAPIGMAGNQNNFVLSPDSNMTLLGGDISISDYFVGSRSGAVQLGSVGPNTAVAIDSETHQLAYAPDTDFRDINIQGSIFNVSVNQDLNLIAGGSGDIRLQGRAVNINASNLTTENAGPEDGGTIDIRASENITVADSRITTTLGDGFVLVPSDGLPYTRIPSEGRGGNIFIETSDFTVKPTTKIGADTYSSGSAGSIVINADTVSLLGSEERVTTDGTQSVRLVANSFETGDSGSITVNAETMTVVGSTAVSASTFSAEGSEDKPGAQSGAGGSVSLNIGGLFSMEGGATVATLSLSDADAGSLTIRAKDIVVSDQHAGTLAIEEQGTAITTNGLEDGEGGDLLIEAETLTVSGLAVIASASSASPTQPVGPDFQFGNGGSLVIDAGAVRIENGAQITTGTAGNGNAGDIKIYADDLTLIGRRSDDPSLHLSSTISAGSFGGTGNGGDLLLDVGSLTMGEGAEVGTSTFSSGDAGELTVLASSRIDIDGFLPADPAQSSFGPSLSGIFNTAEVGSQGDSGNLTVETPQLNLSGGGILSVGTAGAGNAGNLKIRAGEISVADASFDPNGSIASRIEASVYSLGSGQGGQIDIESDRITLRNGGQITASTDGAGDAGSVNIQSEVVDLSGTSADGFFSSAISSRATTAFDAGSVNLTSDRINIRDQGIVTVSSSAGGSAGNVSLVANSVSLNNGSIQAEANAGNQGNINIESRDVLLMREGSRLTTNATETATGGNISINAPLIVGAENSDISANAVEGDGGNIQLVTNGLVGLAFRDELTVESDITATSELGVNGTVNIESPSVDTDSGLVQLPENVEDASNQVVASCAIQDGNQFTSTGRGGLPNNPLTMLSSNQPWQDMRAVRTQSNLAESDKAVVTNPAQALDSTDQTVAEEIMEAQQWYLTDSGEVELLAARTVEAKQNNCLAQEMAMTPSSIPSTYP